MKEVRDAIMKIMERTTLAELIERERKLQREPLAPFHFAI